MILRQLDSAVTIAAKAGSIMSVEDLVALWASYVQRRTERAA
jgi:hypothetical protein